VPARRLAHPHVRNPGLQPVIDVTGNCEALGQLTPAAPTSPAVSNPASPGLSNLGDPQGQASHPPSGTDDDGGAVSLPPAVGTVGGQHASAATPAADPQYPPPGALAGTGNGIAYHSTLASGPAAAALLPASDSSALPTLAVRARRSKPAAGSGPRVATPRRRKKRRVVPMASREDQHLAIRIPRFRVIPDETDIKSMRRAGLEAVAKLLVTDADSFVPSKAKNRAVLRRFIEARRAHLYARMEARDAAAARGPRTPAASLISPVRMAQLATTPSPPASEASVPSSTAVANAGAP